jgi:hypothetical protein
MPGVHASIVVPDACADALQGAMPMRRRRAHGDRPMSGRVDAGVRVVVGARGSIRARIDFSAMGCWPLLASGARLARIGVRIMRA